MDEKKTACKGHVLQNRRQVRRVRLLVIVIVVVIIIIPTLRLGRQSQSGPINDVAVHDEQTVSPLAVSVQKDLHSLVK